MAPKSKTTKASSSKASSSGYKATMKAMIPGIHVDSDQDSNNDSDLEVHPEDKARITKQIADDLAKACGDEHEKMMMAQNK